MVLILVSWPAEARLSQRSKFSLFGPNMVRGYGCDVFLCLPSKTKGPSLVDGNLVMMGMEWLYLV